MEREKASPDIRGLEQTAFSDGQWYKRRCWNFSDVSGEFGFCLTMAKNYTVRKPLQEHLHRDSYEIVYMIRGRQVYGIKDRRFCVNGGQFFITAPNVVHSSAEMLEDKSYFFYLLLQDKEISGPTGNARDWEKAIWDKLRSAAESGGQVYDCSLVQIEKKLLALAETYDREGSLQKLRIITALWDLLLETADCMQGQDDRRAQFDFATVLGYIDRHIFEKISVAQLAREVNFSTSAFSRKFVEEMKLTPHEYILREKIQKAQQLLLENKMGIGDIAKALSFSSDRYFRKVFIRFAGMTPSDFRKLQQIKKGYCKILLLQQPFFTWPLFH